MDADWKRFLDADYREVGVDPASYKLKSHDQLDFWVQHLEHASRRHIWELAFKFPSDWYGGEFELLANVLNKLDQRIREVRASLLHFINKGPRKGVRTPSPSKIA